LRADAEWKVRKRMLLYESSVFRGPKTIAAKTAGGCRGKCNKLSATFPTPSPLFSSPSAPGSVTRCCTIIQIYEPWLRGTSGGLRFVGVKGRWVKVGRPLERTAEAVIRWKVGNTL